MYPCERVLDEESWRGGEKGSFEKGLERKDLRDGLERKYLRDGL